MANRKLFTSWAGRMLRMPDTRNDEGAPAFSLPPKHALAQYAMTGCLNGTFYASDAAQLEAILELCGRVEPEFIARTAVHAREVGFMKDLPALLCAVLAVRDGDLLPVVFRRVIDSPRMLRNFVQIVRSGAVGRKSLGTRPRRLVREWLRERSDEAIFAASVGTRPSLTDIVRMVHPKPASPSREALYGYLLGRGHDTSALPDVVRRYEAFKADDTRETPDVPFAMLTSLDLTEQHWVEIARRAPWQTTRINLNTFARHGVFRHEGMGGSVAARLRDPEEIRKARAMPYQLMVAHMQVARDVPREVRDALQDAAEIAMSNVPRIPGRIVVCTDVSGSMASPVTGRRRGATTVVRCVDVAALMAAAIVRQNPAADVLAFREGLVDVRIDSRDSVMTNARRLADVVGGGTNCSAPLEHLNRIGAKPDLVIFVSDNQSWVDARPGAGTAMMREWEGVRSRNGAARLVCIDLQPNRTSQAYDREDVLNVGGFSDGVFDVVARFAMEGSASGTWVEAIERIDLRE
jgi:60 kDa SS-A/Ro ribonucleoprotein